MAGFSGFFSNFIEVTRLGSSTGRRTSENLLVTMQGLPGYAFAGEGEMGVVLDTNITEELQEEGHVREILSKIQNMRKESGFEVADKIKTYVSGNEMLQNVIKKFEEQIKKDKGGSIRWHY